MEDLLYPAYQKYYSAMLNLTKFNIDNNFFDNIAYLDNFFSEYRSVTLVMQKSLAHTPYIKDYEQLSTNIWDSFFNKQRVKSIHTHPIEFTKQIDITVYSPSDAIIIASENFTIDNDIPLVQLIDSLKNFFNQINQTEIFFSATFSFIEKDNNINILNKIASGLETMQTFMNNMYNIIQHPTPKCEHLRKEIDKLLIYNDLNDILQCVDYVYYPKTDSFEKADIITAKFLNNHSNIVKKLPLNKFCSNYTCSSNFIKFILMHACIGSTDLMPTIMTIYKDGTYELDTFHSSIKTTIYRKINETAHKILHYNIEEIFIMLTYISLPDTITFTETISKERLKFSDNEYLVFIRINDHMLTEEYIFDNGSLQTAKSIIDCINNNKTELNYGRTNMSPIVNAFKNKSTS